MRWPASNARSGTMAALSRGASSGSCGRRSATSRERKRGDDPDDANAARPVSGAESDRPARRPADRRGADGLGRGRMPVAGPAPDVGGVPSPARRLGVVHRGGRTLRSRSVRCPGGRPFRHPRPAARRRRPGPATTTLTTMPALLPPGRAAVHDPVRVVLRGRPRRPATRARPSPACRPTPGRI
jgi:hypothetical protein